MQEAFKVRDEMEARNLRIRALAQTLAEPEHILAHKEMAAKRRAEASIREPRPKQYIPGLVGPGPMSTVNPSGSGMATPMPSAGNAEQANSPLWYRAVELAVNKLGLNADKAQLRAEAMRTWNVR
jgi:hypothetical protein